MSKIEDGGSAFPIEGGEMSGLHSDPGMSLRDWFAGQALAGQWVGRESDFIALTAPTALNVAESAYRIADAMIAARKTGGQ